MGKSNPTSAASAATSTSFSIMRDPVLGLPFLTLHWFALLGAVATLVLGLRHPACHLLLRRMLDGRCVRALGAEVGGEEGGTPTTPDLSHAAVRVETARGHGKASTRVGTWEGEREKG